MATTRMATTADARGLAEVRVRGWQVGYEGIVDAEFLASMSVDENERRWFEIIEERGEQIRVAVVDGVVVGFASSGPYRLTDLDGDLTGSTSLGELYGFYVHPNSWGTGVAAKLHAVAVGALWADGWALLKLWVLEGNSRARRFYERNGWSADGARQALTLPGAPMEVRYELLTAV